MSYRKSRTEFANVNIPQFGSSDSSSAVISALEPVITARLAESAAQRADNRKQLKKQVLEREMAAPSKLNKVIILTGGSRGIGAAAVRHLVQSKCHVVVVSRTKSALEKIQSEYPSSVRILPIDVVDPSTGSKSVKLATDTWGRIDGLVLNHGSLDPVELLKDANTENWKRAFDVNVFSSIGIIKEALPHLRQSKGNIVFTTSGVTSNPMETWASYGCTKSCLNYITRSLAMEEPDINPIALDPGIVDTQLVSDVTEKYSETMNSRDISYITKIRKAGKLLSPEQPGIVIARLGINTPRELRGKTVKWNDAALNALKD